MNVHHLELFYYVAKYEGITSAVRKMPYGIQQPAVSGQLLQLEESLGVKLFNRRPFSLTQAGELLYDHVYPFFSRLGDMEEKLRGGESVHLRIAASAAVLRHHLPELLLNLREEIPELRLTLRDIDVLDIPSFLSNQHADLAVTVINCCSMDGMRTEVLMELPLMLWLPEDHPAEKLSDFLDDGEIEIPFPLVGLPSDTPVTQLFQKGIEQNGMVWPVSVEVEYLEDVLQFVRCGFGAGVGVKIPKMEVPKGLKAIELSRFSPVVLGIVYQGTLKPVARKFIDSAVKLAESLMRE